MTFNCISIILSSPLIGWLNVQMTCHTMRKSLDIYVLFSLWNELIFWESKNMFVLLLYYLQLWWSHTIQKNNDSYWSISFFSDSQRVFNWRTLRTSSWCKKTCTSSRTRVICYSYLVPLACSNLCAFIMGPFQYPISFYVLVKIGGRSALVDYLVMQVIKITLILLIIVKERMKEKRKTKVKIAESAVVAEDTFMEVTE